VTRRNRQWRRSGSTDALKLALKGSDGIVDFCDRLQPYLVLRVRGHVASWLVKTRVRTLKIGDAVPSAT
jgi:hypothetical protein